MNINIFLYPTVPWFVLYTCLSPARLPGSVVPSGERAGPGTPPGVAPFPPLSPNKSIDWLIVFYALSAVFQQYNGGETNKYFYITLTFILWSLSTY